MRFLIRLFLVAVTCHASVDAVAAQDQTADDLHKLEGRWVVVSAEQRGRPLDTIKGGELVIEGSVFHLHTGARSDFNGEVQVDAWATPRQLDFIHAEGGFVWNAIYVVDDDTLRVNYVEAGGRNPRPPGFATTWSDGETVMVMSRISKP